MIFYIADMHFGHENVLRFDDRPFSEIGQMDETLIQNWNDRGSRASFVFIGKALRSTQKSMTKTAWSF